MDSGDFNLNGVILPDNSTTVFEGRDIDILSQIQQQDLANIFLKITVKLQVCKRAIGNKVLNFFMRHSLSCFFFIPL